MAKSSNQVAYLAAFAAVASLGFFSYRLGQRYSISSGTLQPSDLTHLPGINFDVQEPRSARAGGRSPEYQVTLSGKPLPIQITDIFDFKENQIIGVHVLVPYGYENSNAPAVLEVTTDGERVQSFDLGPLPHYRRGEFSAKQDPRLRLGPSHGQKDPFSNKSQTLRLEPQIPFDPQMQWRLTLLQTDRVADLNLKGSLGIDGSRPPLKDGSKPRLAQTGNLFDLPYVSESRAAELRIEPFRSVLRHFDLKIPNCWLKRLEDGRDVFTANSDRTFHLPNGVEFTLKSPKSDGRIDPNAPNEGHALMYIKATTPSQTYPTVNCKLISPLPEQIGMRDVQIFDGRSRSDTVYGIAAKNDIPVTVPQKPFTLVVRVSWETDVPQPAFIVRVPIER